MNDDNNKNEDTLSIPPPIPPSTPSQLPSPPPIRPLPVNICQQNSSPNTLTTATPPNTVSIPSNATTPSIFCNWNDYASGQGWKFTEYTFMAETKYWGEAILCGQRVS